MRFAWPRGAEDSVRYMEAHIRELPSGDKYVVAPNGAWYSIPKWVATYCLE